MNAFLFRIRRLLGDRAFILSAGLSVVSVFIFMSTAVYLLGQDKINITKIADVEFNNDMIGNGISFKPISGMFQLVKADLSNPNVQREINQFKSHIWKGYLTRLSTFCHFGYVNDKAVGIWVGSQFTPRRILLEVDTIADVIVTTKSDRVTATAGVIKFAKNTCEIAKKLNDNEQIYVVSDKEFGETDEPPTYLSIVKIDK